MGDFDVRRSKSSAATVYELTTDRLQRGRVVTGVAGGIGCVSSDGEVDHGALCRGAHPEPGTTGGTSRPPALPWASPRSARRPHVVITPWADQQRGRIALAERRQGWSIIASESPLSRGRKNLHALACTRSRASSRSGTSSWRLVRSGPSHRAGGSRRARCSKSAPSHQTTRARRVRCPWRSSTATASEGCSASVTSRC